MTLHLRSDRGAPGLRRAGCLAWRAGVLALGLLGMSGCATVGYYAQSIRGQMALLNDRVPIKKVLARPDTPPALARKLRLVLKVRRFASKDLGLPDNGSYRSYVDLHRRFVVWNVFATPTLSLRPITWCYPLVGCLSYRGYFSKQAADAFAAGLARRGDDVYVGGVAAYSTLGWFDDPLLSSMLYWDDAHVAKVIFHELAHQELYVKGDTAFNEAFAVTTATEGVRRWLRAQENPAAWAAFQRDEQMEQQFVALVLRTRSRLEEVYASKDSRAQKLAAKRQAFARMLDEYRALKRQWGGYDGYDEWMYHDMNNAKLASVETYQAYVPAFEHLLRMAGGNMPAYYALARRVGHLASTRRRRCLDELRAARTGPAPACELPASPGAVAAGSRSTRPRLAQRAQGA